MYKGVPELSLRAYTEGSEADRKSFIDELYSGIKHYGFIILKDHDLDIDLLNQAYEQSESLFNLDEGTKLQYVPQHGEGQRGYIPFGKEHAKDSKAPDLKEFWHVGQELSKDHPYFGDYALNVWPDNELPQFKPTLLSMYQALEKMGDIILEALTPSLDVPKDFFRPMTKDGNHILRLLHYPPIQKGVDPNCVRAAAHEDINLMTILVAASASGLELLDRDGTWLPIETSKNNLIVDAGDMMARLTNDVIPSTTHRVVNPDDGQRDQSRYSMPFFIQTNPEAMLECLPSCIGDGAKYPPVRAQDFLLERLRDIGVIKN